MIDFEDVFTAVDEEIFKKTKPSCIEFEVAFNKAGRNHKMQYIFTIYPEALKLDEYGYVELAHEMVHVCQFVSKIYFDRSVELEAEAYLHTHLMSQAINFLKGK